MKLARSLLIFTYGLFTLAAQTLIFRQFISSFEGNDISVGLFFGSWFLSIAIGALFVYGNKTFAQKLLANIEFLFLAYLPAFILQSLLIIQARSLAGLTSYALLSIRDVLLLSMMVNIPIGIITGMLFPLACRWIQQDRGFAISLVYIIEAAGSFIGGLGVTILLAIGASPVKIFFILAFIVSLSVFAVRLTKGFTNISSVHRASVIAVSVLCLLLPLGIALCLVFGADNALTRYVQTVRWSKLLPKNSYIGSFTTAQAEYLYGIYNGQWVAMREGSTVEALPNENTTGRIAALCLCQNPDAKRILVVGSGLGLCYEFLKLPQVENVTWGHFDSEYTSIVERFIPAGYKKSDVRFHRITGDVRSQLTAEKKYFDIVILNLPEATSSILNRYYTQEFYQEVRESLQPNGLLAVRITGGENIMGTELINLGASTKLTLQKVFSYLVLTPGDDTWFIVSDSPNLTGAPGVLHDRFAKIDGSNRIFVPEALLSVYLPDRAKAALDTYSTGDLPDSLLVNHDARPLTNLYSLLFAAKQSDSPVTQLVKLLALAGPVVYFVPLLVFAAMRIIYIVKTPQQIKPSSFDSSFLVFSAGWVCIGVVIVLMYLYQARFGSLYLHIGIISSLFMVGLTIGALLISYLANRIAANKHGQWNVCATILLAAIFVNIVILSAIGLWQDKQWTHVVFAAAFLLCGMCGGCYFPLAAAGLVDAGLEVGKAGSKLETADHIGAAAGGLVTGLALVPVLGIKFTLAVFILLLLTNAPPAVLRAIKFQRGFIPLNLAFRRVGYILFGIGASLIVCSNLLAFAGSKLAPSLPLYTALSLAGQSHVEQASGVLPDSGKRITYFKVYKTDKIAGYIFSSQDLSPEVTGFGGKINIAIYVDVAGNLIDFHIVRSNETPSYLELLKNWWPVLKGRKLFQPQPFADIDAVSGATISSKAVISALQTSGQRFVSQILGAKSQSDKNASEAEIQTIKLLPDREGLYLITAFALAVAVIYFGEFWSRLAVLLLNLIVGGIILNVQYSSEQVASLLSLQTPAIGLTGVCLLVLGIPLLTALVGNMYCGYICPFGIVQELLSYLVPKKLKEPLSIEKVQKARFIKYTVLFVLVAGFFVCRNRLVLNTDPMISFFNRQAVMSYWLACGMPTVVVLAVIFIGALFYTRFWCRYLCPAGAFLSLLNGVAILKRFLPAKRFAGCEFGLSASDHLDCLYCDRCRYTISETRCTKPRAFKRSKILLPFVVLIAAFICVSLLSRLSQMIPASLKQPVVSTSSGGQPRDVDLQRIRNMIEQKKLSDKEAEFYKKTQ